LAANPESDDIDGRLETLARRTGPAVAFPLEVLGDSNGITLHQAGAEIGYWPAGAARVRIGWTAGTIAQDAYRFDRRAFSVRLDQLLPTPAVRLDASAGMEDYGAATLPVWSARAQLDLASGGFVAIRTARETPWSAETRLDSQRYNRIGDLSSVGPAFHSTGVGGLAELPLSSRASLRVDGGWQRYSDANAQTALFVQFQHQLTSRPDGSLWVALQPQVYLESWSERRLAYYSPDFHLGTGVGLRAQMHRGAWHLDGNAIPQLMRAGGGQGFGMFGSAGLTRLFGRVSVGGEAMIFDDRRGDYRLRRVTAEVRIPVGR
jgi:hypothetical protein